MTSAHRQRIANFTLDDWERLEPAEGQRVELVDGQFRVNAAPTPRHQRIGDRLGRLLAPVVEPLGLDVLTAVGVRVRPGVGYIPDLVVCEPQDDDAVSVLAGSVQLVVEVVSPSSRKLDRFEQPQTYAAAGIPAYWRVELVKHRPPTLFCYRVEAGSYAEHAAVTTGAPQQITLPFGATVTLDVNLLDKRPVSPG